MTPTWGEVNAAILAVLGRNGHPGRLGGPVAGGGTSEVFADRLFSARHAEAVGEVDEVRILAGTVVTPLARDLLKRRRIGLRVVSAREAGPGRSGEWGFAIESRSGLAGPIRRALLDDWSEVGPDAAVAARWVAESDDRGAMVVADEASVATWRAGRVGGVRAATVSEPEAVSRAIRALGVNLIVVEPAGRSIHLLKQVGERFRKGGAPTRPDWLVSEAAP